MAVTDRAQTDPLDHIQVGAIHIAARDAVIEIEGELGSKIEIPKQYAQDVIEFLAFHAGMNNADRRRSWRLKLDPGELAATLAIAGRFVKAEVIDISLGGALLKAVGSTSLPEVGDRATVVFQLDGDETAVECEVVRRLDDNMALRFTDCERNGEIIPTTAVAQLCDELQRRWLTERVKR